MDAHIYKELTKYKYNLLQTEYQSVVDKRRGGHLTHIDYEELPAEMTVYFSENRKVMVITPPGEHIQANFKLRSFLVRKDLPPIRENTKFPLKPTWTNQFVTISSLGCPEFDKAIRAFMTIHHMFSTKASKGNMQKFTMSTFNSFPSLNFPCRYFPGNPDGTGEDIPEEINLTGKLAKFRKGLHYNADNRVAYLHQENEPKEGCSVSVYTPTDSGTFGIVQIMEVQFNFCARILQSKWKVFYNLLAIATFDRTMNKWILQPVVQSATKPTSTPVKLSLPSKRALMWGFEDKDENMLVASKKLKGMCLEGFMMNDSNVDTKMDLMGGCSREG